MIELRLCHTFIFVYSYQCTVIEDHKWLLPLSDDFCTFMLHNKFLIHCHLVRFLQQSQHSTKLLYTYTKQFVLLLLMPFIQSSLEYIYLSKLRSVTLILWYQTHSIGGGEGSGKGAEQGLLGTHNKHRNWQLPNMYMLDVLA